MRQIDRQNLRARIARLRERLPADARPLPQVPQTGLEGPSSQAGAPLWAPTGPCTPQLPCSGARIKGTYLGHRFQGRLDFLARVRGTAVFRVGVCFDTPVNAFEGGGLSVYRNKVTAMVDGNGVSLAQTSTGTPYLVVEANPGFVPFEQHQPEWDDLPATPPLFWPEQDARTRVCRPQGGQ
ncbi:hypothetical protein GCM10011316_24590 [Roseibium aquae]|uniref:Glyoxalase-related protein domain-containing protein n=1 Tax=Roseibium aquae TaxID=1323746 RepID=A0A916X251_9HYPH|nr:glyoxalase superfamily protein [Roseibium aquae]GGB51680.1 hypothetical protein GCM10011316_24590 [Roseibium aquae]